MVDVLLNSVVREVEVVDITGVEVESVEVVGPGVRATLAVVIVLCTEAVVVDCSSLLVAFK